jgi:Zn finger protein HypA/HybF involved in hydrogenase expression
MEKKEEPEQKEVKILKCEKCGEEYLYDSTSRICPECKGTLKIETVVTRSPSEIVRQY